MEVNTWVESHCDNCGEKVEFEPTDLRQNCDINGDLVVRCPSCKIGKVKVHVDLDGAEFIDKMLEF